MVSSLQPVEQSELVVVKSSYPTLASSNAANTVNSSSATIATATGTASATLGSYPTPQLTQQCALRWSNSWVPDQWKPANAPVMLGNDPALQQNYQMSFATTQPFYPDTSSLQTQLSTYFNTKVSDAQCFNRPLCAAAIYNALAGLTQPSTITDFTVVKNSTTQYNTVYNTQGPFVYYAFGFGYPSLTSTPAVLCACECNFQWQDNGGVRWYAFAFFQSNPRPPTQGQSLCAPLLQLLTCGLCGGSDTDTDSGEVGEGGGSNQAALATTRPPSADHNRKDATTGQ